MIPRRAARSLAVLAALAAVAACAPPAGAQVLLPTGFADQFVVGGLSLPVGMAFLPDGRLFVIEQKTARVRLLVNGALAATDPALAVPGVRTQGSEQGLLGIAVDPGWPLRPYVYLHYDALDAAVIRVSRFTASGDLLFSGNGSLTLDPASRYDLLTDIPDNAPNHNGGTLRFGPDGMLYASFGEDAAPCAAQDSTTLRGVILRLDVMHLPAGSGGPPGKGLITPADNPFVTSSNSNTRLIWALGLRNPFRFHVDGSTGRLFIADVGQSRYEELDVAGAPGLDFGWPLFEGPAPYTSCPGVAPAGYAGPVYFYDRAGFTASVVSGGVYRRTSFGGVRFPAEYEGDYFFSDYYRGFLRRLKWNGATWSLAPSVPGQPNASDWGTGFDAVSDYLVGPDGALWYCRQAVNFQNGTGQIRRVAYVPSSSVPVLGNEAVRFAAPFPSPAPGYVNLSYTLARNARVELALFDAEGRRVRRLVGPVTQVATRHDVTWDGLDDAGARVRPGLYFALLSVDGAVMEHRIPLLR